MFLKVNTFSKDGTVVPKHVNLLMITIIHDIKPDDKDNKHGHKSVMYNSNGYASYSFLTADEVVSALQGNIVTEDSIQQHEGN